MASCPRLALYRQLRSVINMINGRTDQLCLSIESITLQRRGGRKMFFKKNTKIVGPETRKDIFAILEYEKAPNSSIMHFKTLFSGHPV